jgi:hypothetical protein
LLEDIRALAEVQSQTDPTFGTTRLYTRLTAAEIRQQLIEQKGYREEALPSAETIRVKANQLDYHLRSVQKSRPQKKLPETDAIFCQLDQFRTEALGDPRILRLSINLTLTRHQTSAIITMHSAASAVTNNRHIKEVRHNSIWLV